MTVLVMLIWWLFGFLYMSYTVIEKEHHTVNFIDILVLFFICGLLGPFIVLFRSLYIKVKYNKWEF